MFYVRCFRLVVACFGTAAFTGALHAQPHVRPSTDPAPFGVTPTPRHLDWHAEEYYGFLHFGHNTFTGEEWGWSQQSADVFKPTALDTDQWAREMKNAGMTMMILTTKHHDGFALWDTRTTDYSVTNSSWARARSARGLDSDVVRMAAESADKYGLGFGIYLSPWDMSRDPAVRKGSNASQVGDQIFGDNNGNASSEYGGNYNDYYHAQLTELLQMQISDGRGGTKKIEITEVWLDGASGSSTRQTFDFARFRDTIRANHPNAIMWGHQGVDARWVGNEAGFIQDTNWHTLNTPQPPNRENNRPGRELEIGDRLPHPQTGEHFWTPAEADARLRRHWFYHPRGQLNETGPKSGSALLNMYLVTVGRSATLLLDVPPDRTGRLAPEDLVELAKFKRLREQAIRDLSSGQVTVSASSVRSGNRVRYAAANLVDGDGTTFWATDDGIHTGDIVLAFNGKKLVDGVVLQEYIALGQRIEGYAIDVRNNFGNWSEVKKGTSMGYKRIHLFGRHYETDAVRFRITNSGRSDLGGAPPVLSELQVLGQRHTRWESEALEDAAEISTEGDLMYAYNLGSRDDIRVNDVLFRGTESHAAIEELGQQLVRFTDGELSNDLNFSSKGGALGDLLDSAAWFDANSGVSNTSIALGGLEAHRQYLVQILIEDCRGESRSREVTVDEGFETELGGLETFEGVSIVGRFVASGARQTVELKADNFDSVQVNAIQVRDLGLADDVEDDDMAETSDLQVQPAN